MFLTPRKKIVASRHKQRGNLVFEVGLPPQLLPPIAGDIPGGLGPGWSLIEEWNSTGGDLTAITTAFGSARGDGFAFSPDGKKLTMGNSSNDTIKTFTLSEAWNPNTAVETSSRGVTNPNIAGFNSDGSLLFTVWLVGDEILALPCTNYVIDTSGAFTTLTKTDVGFTGSQDSSPTFSENGDFLIWLGTDLGEAAKRITVPGGDLDAFVVQQTIVDSFVNATAATGESPITLDNKTYYKCRTSSGLLRRDMDPALDISTIDWDQANTESLSGVTTIWPSWMWFNPRDTSEIWIQGDMSSAVQFVRIATNIPET